MGLDFSIYKEVKCPYCGEVINKEEVFWVNITHNLNIMAKEAGIYKVLWRPSETNIFRASEAISILEIGLNKLLSEPEKYKKLNSPNGWGTYKHFVPFVKKVLEECKDYPDGFIVADI